MAGSNDFDVRPIRSTWQNKYVAPIAAPAAQPQPVEQPATAAPVQPSAPAPNALPAGIARRQAGDSQIYMGVGAHGEPVFSDSVAGTQSASRARGNGAIPDSLDVGDQHAIDRRAIGNLNKYTTGGFVGPVPDAYRQPVAQPGVSMGQEAATRRQVADLRSAPGGDTEWAGNSSNLAPGDALRMSPQQRQGHINDMLAYNARKDADPAVVASNRSALAQLDQSLRPGSYDPTGYGASRAAGATGMGGLSQADYLNLVENQANRNLKAQNIQNHADEFNAGRADKLNEAAQKEIETGAAAFNKDNPNDPDARRMAGIQYALDHFTDSTSRGKDAYQKGLNDLQAELRVRGTPTWLGRNVVGSSDASHLPLDSFEVQPNHSLFGGPARVTAPGGYDSTGGMFDFHQRSPVMDRLLKNPRNIDVLQQIIKQQRAARLRQAQGQ